nr:DUF4325 domain-containing protein [uncultured Aggregatibacter sp.]
MSKNNISEIEVIKCFKGKPRYRYSKDIAPGEEDTSGERFRTEFLLPCLKNGEKVHVILTGYNRYDPSFLISGFADLIRVNGYTYDQLKQQLSYTHDDLKSFEVLIEDEMKIAERERVAKQGK